MKYLIILLLLIIDFVAPNYVICQDNYYNNCCEQCRKDEIIGGEIIDGGNFYYGLSDYHKGQYYVFFGYPVNPEKEFYVEKHSLKKKDGYYLYDAFAFGRPLTKNGEYFWVDKEHYQSLPRLVRNLFTNWRDKKEIE